MFSASEEQEKTSFKMIKANDDRRETSNFK